VKANIDVNESITSKTPAKRVVVRRATGEQNDREREKRKSIVWATGREVINFPEPSHRKATGGELG
jgi:hypothetical protein